MRLTINRFTLLFSIINIFFIPFVAYKVYGYYFPHVGFELPELSYLNVFALMIMVKLFSTEYNILVYIIELHSVLIDQDEIKSKNNPRSNSFKVFLIGLSIWILNWLFHLIFY